MYMFNSLLKTGKKLFGDQHDFRARLFHILAVAGILISLVVGVVGIFIGAGLANFLLSLLAMLLASVILYYSLVSGKYQRCYMIAIICIFFGLFPFLFFSAGGYHSGMPSFFIFAVLFTVFMLEGKKMVVMTVLELAFYTTLCIYAYYNPGKVDFFNTEADFLSDILLGFLTVSAALGVTMSMHFRMYKQRQTELEFARKQVEEYAKMRSELFAGMSHEMRTPLTVMSTYAQFAVEQIRESGVNEQTLTDLATISDEAKRLAIMADSTMKILMGEYDADDIRVFKNSPVNIGDVCSRLVRLLKPVALRNGMELSAVITDNVPVVLGDVDALTQLVWNILQNTITHSGGKVIELIVETDGGNVKVTVNDDGTGVDPDILPRIFECGISGKKDGSGIGLSICYDIVKQHSGEITIKSEPENGTCVTVILRGGGENV
jgi:signal transduction histidine kinase